MIFPTGCTSRAGGWSRRTPTWWAAPSSSVMAPPARAPVAGVSEMPDPALTLVGGVAKGIVYLGLVLLLGLLPAAFVLGSGPSVLRRVRTVAEVGAVLTVLASLVQLWTQFLGSLPPGDPTIDMAGIGRSEERRVGREGRSRGAVAYE